MEPHSSTLAWKIPWMEEPGGLQSIGSLRVRHAWVTSLSLSCIGEGHGNPLQCSCLENPRNRGAWWAAVCAVTQSWTRLKRLSSSSSSSRDRTQVSCIAGRLPSEPSGKLKNTGVGTLSLLQGIFLTQESNQGVLHCRWILHQLSYQLVAIYI